MVSRNVKEIKIKEYLKNLLFGFRLFIMATHIYLYTYHSKGWLDYKINELILFFLMFKSKHLHSNETYQVLRPEALFWSQQFLPIKS